MIYQYKTDIDGFQEWLKTQIVGIDNKTHEILVVKEDKWELAIDEYKKQFYKEKDQKFIHLTVQEFDDVYNQGRADAIDECIKAIYENTGNPVWEYGEGIYDCIKAIEQLKAGSKE